MTLSAREIRDRLWDGVAEISAEHSMCVVPIPNLAELEKKKPAAIDLRLGRWFRTMRQSRLTELKVGDNSSEARLTAEHYVRFNGEFVLHPGQFVIGITLEWLRFPYNLSGYVTGKSSWGRRGLVIETAAGIHPGFIGCLTLELANVGTVPITLNPGIQICQLFLHHVNNREGATSTQFIGCRKPGLGRIEQDEVYKALSKQYFT